MSIVTDIKNAIKIVIDNTDLLGIVYSKDRKTLDRMPAMTMWWDGFEQEPGSGKSTEVGWRFLLRVHVQLNDEGKAQDDIDTLVPQIMDALRCNPQLDTGSGPLIRDSIVTTGDVNARLDRDPQIIAELTYIAYKEES